MVDSVPAASLPAGLPLDCLVQVVHLPLGDQGEDSFAYNFSLPALHTQAVFDGCGGSGAWQYSEYRGATGAFVSSHIVARVYLDWFNALDPSALPGADHLALSFHDAAEAALKKAEQSCAPMRVSGSLVKSFPTTASVALVRRADASSLSLTALNAGDSRVYFLTPASGLVQLTDDDSRGNPDPLESLRAGAPMSNLISASSPFEIRAREVRVPLPCAVICASDGVFGFLRSPMDFEYVLLDSLRRASSFSVFEEALKQAVVRVTGDDSTCLVSFYGFDSLARAQQLLRPRYLHVASLIRMLDNAGSEAEISEVMAKIWPEYKAATVFSCMRKQE